MNKDVFISFITNPSKITEADIPVLEEFILSYPYCQIGHLLLAKISHDYNKPDKTLKLNRAALYTPTRSVLKDVIEKGWEALDENIEQHFAEPDQSSQNDHQTMKDKLFDNQDTEEAKIGGQAGEEEQKSAEFGHDESSEDKNEMPESSQPQFPDVADQIIEAIEENRKLREEFKNREKLENITNQPESDNKRGENEVIQNPQGISENPEPEKAVVDESRKKEQDEIIENFINFENSLVKRKLRIPEETSAPQEDLSLKSSLFDDDLVSENLALIMKKQGKINKAIDIYKKLIWKFPQKKTYFAALIEELKKK